ncbi:DNA methyltransferase 1-associated protein 1 [Entomortierella parvispora]|uniref:SWR1-complex protein 4 n=1 Tax=Entomortierella parvispora TaxID=205924 RepID=A0A9P3HLN3_9FUNG|nr:DNA methyltransferase 1-associated protein 1 [Entomortierella parvispora]
MATGNDVREIFQLSKSDQVKRVHKTEKKPDGISRELYGLIGNNVSTVAFNNPTYKPKLNLSTKAVNWTWRPFVNPSRDDDLILHHWEKTRTDPNEEYRFYKFNKAINLNEFTAEEYRSHLQDPDWTLEETNYLWDLCRRFDLRWVVIQDRYEWPPQEVDRIALQYYNGNKLVGKNGADASTESSVAAITAPTGTDTISPSLLQPSAISSDSTLAGTSTTTTPAAPTPTDVSISKPQEGSESAAPTPSTDVVAFTPAKTRTMEDLKNRYYTVNRILIKARMTDGSQAMEKAHLLSSMNYDQSREVERKKNLEILNTRTPEQIEEEEALYLEARRIDQNEKKISRERENLLRLLNTRDIYGPGGPASAGLTPGGSLAAGGPGSGIIIPSNSITIPSSGPANNGANGPISPSSSKPALSNSASGASVKKKKRPPKGSTQAEEAAAAAAAAASAASSAKGSSNNRRLSNSSVDGSSSNLPQGVQVKKEKLTPGAYLRSQKMTPIVSTKQQRLQATLVQLGLPLKPAMPTVNVMAKWDQLQNNIVTLLDLKKQVDKLESDLKVVKIRRGSGSGVNLFPASSSASAGGGSGSNSSSALSSAAGSATSLTGLDGSHSVKREGTVDDALPGQVKKKKRKE